MYIYILIKRKRVNTYMKGNELLTGENTNNISNINNINNVNNENNNTSKNHPQQNTFRFPSGVVISSEFDSGNLQYAEETSNYNVICFIYILSIICGYPLIAYPSLSLLHIGSGSISLLLGLLAITCLPSYSKTNKITYLYIYI